MRAPALGIWAGAAFATMSHAEVAAFVAGNRELPEAGNSAEIAKIGAMLRAFSNGEEATLA